MLYLLFLNDLHVIFPFFFLNICYPVHYFVIFVSVCLKIYFASVIVIIIIQLYGTCTLQPRYTNRKTLILR